MPAARVHPWGHGQVADAVPSRHGRGPRQRRAQRTQCRPAPLAETRTAADPRRTANRDPRGHTATARRALGDLVGAGPPPAAATPATDPGVGQPGWAPEYLDR